MKEVSDEVWEIAQDLYEDADFNINRYGELESFEVMAYEDYNGYYRDCTEADFEEAKKYLEELLDGVKYYEGKLVLSDNETANDIDYQAMTPPKPNEVDDFWAVYEMIYSQALENFEQETGVEIYGLGRSGKHICVDDTFVNLTHLEELKNLQQKWEEWLKDEIVKHYTATVEEVTESLNKGEKKARCLCCGADVIYTNRDVCHDIDGDYIECPNCNATFDVDYDNIAPLLNKKIESYEVWQRYFEDGEIARPEYVQSFDTFEKAQKFADGLNEDPDCEAWVKDLNISKKVTEAEDMTQVKDDVKNAVDKSDSTKQEKDQVKGSIDVLKTDEESAIDGYEEFNKETAKVVDKELSDEIDNQMQEIVDDEKEHIEKLDTIKSALGESKKEEEYDYFDNNEYTYFIIKDTLPTIHEIYWVINRKNNTIIEIEDGKIEDVTEDCKQHYNKDKKQHPENWSYNYMEYTIGTHLYIGLLTGEYHIKYNDGVILYTNNEEEFNTKLNEILNNKSALEENKKEEDCTQANAIQGPTTVFGSKDNKLEEEVDNATIKERLNTGVLRIIDVDMYSINDEIPESATQEGLDEIVQDIAPKYIKEVIQEVLPSVEIYATGVYHPKQYNFSGDELEFDLVANKEEYEALKEKVTSNENFNAYLRNNYKSYDGFISYMADDISEFETQDTWKQVVQVIMFAIQDEDNFEAIKNEYLDEFLDRVHTEFGWNDEDDLEENKEIDVSPIEELEGLTEEVSNGK